MKKLSALFLLAAALLAAPAASAEEQKRGGPDPGQPAPDFTLKDHEGKDVKLSDLKGQVVVLEWTNPQCPFVKRHYEAGTMKTLAAEFAGKNVKWLAIDSSHFVTVAENKKWADEKQLPYPVLDDHEGKVGAAYGARTTPDMFVIDAEGKVAYRGAIDDDPYGENKAPKNYVRAAVEAVLAGKAAAEPETRPYGCTVKYAKK